MNNDRILWLAVIGLLIAGTATGVYKVARGIRNKNPGNIRHGSSKWQGMSVAQTDSAFVQFDDPVYGVRALAKLIQNYQSRYGLATIRQIINRWAPPSENDTGAYVAHVARKAGVGPDESVDIKTVLPQVVTTIIAHENGFNPYDLETIQRGISLAS